MAEEREKICAHVKAAKDWLGRRTFFGSGSRRAPRRRRRDIAKKRGTDAGVCREESRVHRQAGNDCS